MLWEVALVAPGALGPQTLQGREVDLGLEGQRVRDDVEIYHYSRRRLRLQREGQGCCGQQDDGVAAPHRCVSDALAFRFANELPMIQLVCADVLTACHERFKRCR